MKKELFHFLLNEKVLKLTILVFLFASCAIGYHDDETFSSSVSDAQLESPDLTKMKITIVSNSSGAEEFKFEWSVVEGAGGYEFTLYNIDDPDNPIVIGKEKQIVDGCTVKRPKEDDMKYKVAIRTLGRESLNNKDASTPNEIFLSTLVPTFKTIPSGTDLGVYFAENPIPSMSDIPEENNIKEIVYQLEERGEYTMSADVALNLTTVTIRGDKIHHAKLSVTGKSSFICDGAGYKFKWINFDLTDYSGKGFITYNSTMNPSAVNNRNWIAIDQSTQFVSCAFNGLKKPLLYDNSKNYAIREFIFNDCVVQQNLNSSEYFINFSNGCIKDLRMIKSTFYNLTQMSNNWIRYGNIQFDREDKRPQSDWMSAGFNIQNCTFWQIAYGKQIFNSNGYGRSANYVTIEKSIFVDSGNGEVTRRFLCSSNNPTSKFTSNTYWYKGATPSDELKYDKSGTVIDEDPKFTDPSNGNFKVSNAKQISSLTGDPRWLPTATATE